MHTIQHEQYHSCMASSEISPCQLSQIISKSQQTTSISMNLCCEISILSGSKVSTFSGWPLSCKSRVQWLGAWADGPWESVAG